MIILYIFCDSNSSDSISSSQNNPQLSLSHDKNFIYSLSSELGQLYPTETSCYNFFDVYVNSQEALSQFPLTAPFCKEIVDNVKFKQFSPERQKELVQKDAHQIPRTFKLNLISEITMFSPPNLREGTILVKNDIELNQHLEQKAKKFSFKLRDDAVFENGKPINARVIEYTLKQYSTLFNFKDVLGFRDDDYIQLDDSNPFLFTLNFDTEKSLHEVIKRMNQIYLIEPEAFERSLKTEEDNKCKIIQYGTKKHPFISYGPYKIVEGYNDEKWVFDISPSYFGNKIQPEEPIFQKIELLIEKNQGDGEREKELFCDQKISFCALQKDHLSNDEKIISYLDNALFCKPNDYNLILKLSDNARVQDSNLRKALFYGIDRKSLASLSPNLSPTLNLMGDNYIYHQLSSTQFYNSTNEHLQNIENKFENDLKEISAEHQLKQKVNKEILKNSYGYHPELANYFFQKYLTNDNSSDQHIVLILSTRDGAFMNEFFIGKFQEQLKNVFSNSQSISSSAPIEIYYLLNNSSADLDISVLGWKPETLVLPSKKKFIEAETKKTYKLKPEEAKTIANELEPQAYQEMFIIPLCALKQMRFLHNAQQNFMQYFNFFGFRNQPLDHWGA